MRDPALLSRLGKRSDLMSLLVVGIHVAFVLAPVALAARWGVGVHLIPLWLWFGVTMHGLTNLMHECAHYHVFKAREGSNLLGRWILGPLVFANFDRYRLLHWAHHRNLGESDDPKYSYRVDIRGSRLLVLLLGCLSGLEGARKFFHQHAVHADVAAADSRRWVVRLLVVQALLALVLFAAAWSAVPGDLPQIVLRVIVAYGGVYLYGLMSLTLFVATLRAIAEHQAGDDDAATAGHAVLRNLRCGPLGRLVFGCYGFAEHATHHQHPAIPAYHLKGLTADLAARDPLLQPRQGYFSALLAQVRHGRASVPATR
jgi:fatty acid desaturase